MMLHENGYKVQRDRAILLASYRDMAKEFRIPRKDRLSTEQIVKMTNKQLNRACRDLYNGVTVKQARKYGIKRGFIKKPPKMHMSFRAYVANIKLFFRRKLKELNKIRQTKKDNRNYEITKVDPSARVVTFKWGKNG